MGREWILKLAAAGDEGRCVDIMEISKPDDLGDTANLGLTLTEAKQLLARVQREISAAQAREHAVRRPVCPCRDGICRCRAALKDENMPCTIPTGYGQHRYEKLQLKVRLSVGVLHLMGSVAICMLACAASVGQDAEIALLSGLWTKVFRSRHGTIRQPAVRRALTMPWPPNNPSACTEIATEPLCGNK